MNSPRGRASAVLKQPGSDVGFKKSHPEFFAGYHAARVIVDRGGSGGNPTPPAPTPPPA